jgi:hypothetical protein
MHFAQLMGGYSETKARIAQIVRRLDAWRAFYRLERPSGMRVQ